MEATSGTAGGPGEINQNLLERTQRNKQVPINRLANEILWKIFEELAGVSSSELTTPEHSAYGVTSNKWMRILRVCKHWRIVALADPFLWNTIKCDPGRDKAHCVPGDQYVSEWLGRAGGAPLDIYIRDMERVPGPVLQELSARTANLRSLRVSTINHYTQLAVLFQNAAPRLESLHIRREKHPDDPAQGDIPLLFGGKTPSLRYLSLNDVRRFGGNTFKALTYLHISNRHFEAQPAGGAGVPDVLAILRASPRLESCTFKRCTCDVDNPDGHNRGLPRVPRTPENRIVLPSVSRLVLDTCSAAFTVHIMHRVVLSDPLVMFINCKDELPVLPRREHSHVGPLLEATTFRVSFERPSNNEPVDNPPFITDITAITPTSATHLRIWRNAEEFVDHDFDPVGFADWTHHLANTPFFTLQELWLAGKPTGDWRQWHSLFSTLPILRRLTLDFTEADKQAHEHKWFEALLSMGLQLCLPDLRELECHGMSFTQGMMDLLIRIARDRHHSGCRLTHVRILPLADVDGGDPLENLRIIGAWRPVQDLQGELARLRLYVDDVQMEVVAKVPRYVLPAICERCPEFGDQVDF